jgi:hypothetical protein
MTITGVESLESASEFGRLLTETSSMRGGA